MKRRARTVLPDPEGPRTAVASAPGSPPAIISSSPGTPVETRSSPGGPASAGAIVSSRGNTSTPLWSITNVCLPDRWAAPRIFRTRSQRRSMGSSGW
jgi:hypothetical protein